MFTGIVEELGKVIDKRLSVDSARFAVRGKHVAADAGQGDSIAVNGVCLTVVDIVDTDAFTVDVMGETLRHSGIGGLEVGDRVNLERAAPVGGRLGGHIVQGHVDGTATVISRNLRDGWEVVRISLPDALARYVVLKGSVAVDGISLTVSAVGDGWFEVSLIPTTRALTTLGVAPIGAVVNLEVDVVAKYVERLLCAGASER